MFEQFMQMGAAASFFMSVVAAGIGITIIVAIVNKTIRQNQQQDAEFKIREMMNKTKVIEHKHGD